MLHPKLILATSRGGDFFGLSVRPQRGLAEDPAGAGLDSCDDSGLSGIQWRDDFNAQVGMHGDRQRLPRSAAKQEVDPFAAVSHLPEFGRGFDGGFHLG